MSYNALVLEDNLSQLNALSILLNNNSNSIQPFTASTYEDAERLIESHTVFNLFLIDINLGDNQLTGINLAQKIRSIQHYFYTPIIFITGYRQHIYTAINDLHCINYLIKPYDEQDLNIALENALKTPYAAESVVFIKDYYNVLHKVFPAEIQYVKVEKRKQILYFIDGSTMICNYNLSELKNKLGSMFIRCHRLYFVNLKHISCIDCINKVIKINETDIPIGRTYNSAIKKLSNR